MAATADTAPPKTHSADFVELRRVQALLNAFLWSSDISYRFVADSKDPRLANLGGKASQVLAGVKARAWYPNIKGLPHYKKSIGGFLKDVATNETYVYRGIIVQWHAAFESFLDQRMRPFLGKVNNWGPLTSTLCCPQLLHATKPVQLATVLRGDIIRKLRNECAHGHAALPQGINDNRVGEWKNHVSSDLKKRFWPETDLDKAVTGAIQHVFGRVEKRIQTVPPADRALEAAYFYTLFSFTNLEALAREIEAALG
jgi:hypothetical protein